MIRKSPEERFWAKVNKTPTCWEWTGYILSTGYARFEWEGRLQFVHRISYTLKRGAISEGLYIDHLCRNRKCVRPEHLEVVTIKVNTLRGIGITAINARRTHCQKGHPFDENNTLLRKDGRGRECRECHRIWRRNHENRKKNLSHDL